MKRKHPFIKIKEGERKNVEIKDTKIKNIIKCTAKAAITIEATISLTLFMFVVVFLAGFITAVDKQLSTQIKMNRLQKIWQSKCFT